MNILHLSLGIPQMRSGGLVSYAYSLAAAEARQGHNVSLLYPGNLGIINRKSDIKQCFMQDGISIFKLWNPAFVPIPFGIEKPDLMMKKIDDRIYGDFLDRIKPDLVHVHTFMGFTKELFVQVKNRQIPMVYTTHDYYILCPKTTLITEKNENCNGCSPDKCASCNENARNSWLVQYILQSEWYPVIKRTRLLTELKRKRKNILKNSQSIDENQVIEHERILAPGRVNEYKAFLKYQREMLQYVDVIHCNSSITEEIYSQALPEKKKFVLAITTDGIKDNRKITESPFLKKRENLLIGFIGIRDYHKGYWILRDASEILRSRGYHIKAVFYGDEFNIDHEEYPFCIEKGIFPHSKLKEVMDNIDLLVVPGVGYETFGFTVLEGLANNVPVIVSTHVGAKDVLCHVSTPHLFEPCPLELANLIGTYIERPSLLTKAIEEQKRISYQFSIEKHANELLESLNGLIEFSV